ncbi:MAG: hypothetical protein ACE5J2_08870 [Nitrososphaerales archaeon]
MNETSSRLVGYVLLVGSAMAIPTIAAPIVGGWSLDANLFLRALLVIAGTFLGLQLISQGSTTWQDGMQSLKPFAIGRKWRSSTFADYENQKPPMQEEI